MSVEEFISEVRDFKELEVTEKETYYLFLIMLGHNTAYKIYSDLRKENPIAYKNVHQRVKRLSDLKLIEKLSKKADRGAILYRVTSLGLFHLLKNVPILSNYLIEYKNNIILQFLLFRFFEPKTIEYFDTPHASKFLSDYLSITCNAIMQELEEFRYSKRNNKDEFLPDQIELIVNKNIADFVRTIVTMGARTKIKIILRKEKITYDGIVIDLKKLPDELKEHPNYSYLFPLQALKNDKKFVFLLKEIKNEFDEGCKQFIT